jgi:hypothetical protein
MIRILSIAAALAAAPLLAMAQPAPPDACRDAQHHAFDFWIGRWSVTDTETGKPAGQSLVEGLYNGCALRENWSEPGYTGGSLNTYDGVTGKWRQTWTDAANSWREFVGGVEDGKMVLVARRALKSDPAKVLLERMIFTPNTDGSVRQYSDQSTDGGATWTKRYDYTYRKAS